MKKTLVFLTLSLVALGCSGGDGAADGDGAPVEAAAERPLALSSTDGCVTDDDCAGGYFCFQRTCSQTCTTDEECGGGSCSFRGRCIDGEEEEKIPGTLAGLKIERYPDTVRTVASGEAHLSFEFGLDGELPPEGLPYRVWRSDEQSDPSRVLHAPGQDSFTITIPVGAASPDLAEPGDVAVTFFTALGDINLFLRPEAEFEGVWSGTVSVDQFGGQAFPLEVHLVGDDPATMKAALPVRRSSLYSPHSNFGSTSEQERFEVVELVYRPHLNSYQAIFRHSFDFYAGVFNGLESGQVERLLRFDFDAEALERGEVQGRFSDRWTGLFNSQRADGLLEPGELQYFGEFYLERAARLPVHRSEYEVANTLPPAGSGIIERQPVEQCTSEMFTVSSFDAGDVIWDCDGISSIADFEAAGVEERARCALAVSKALEEVETTADQLSAYFAEDGTTSGSFEAFLQACADEGDDACRPAPEAICAFELIAYAARDIDEVHFEDRPQVMRQYRNDLMLFFVEMSREAFLARQLGAFYTDMELRRDWLRQSSAPRVFLNAVEEANRELLDDWQLRVLDVHRELFVDMFNPNALALMGRPANSSEVNERRRELLQEASTLWRSYAEALLLGARRWNEVVRDEAERQELVDFLQTRATELYLSMGMLMEFNRAANAGAQSSLLVSDFAALLEAIESLSRSFDETLFARDAEVVTARSLDPLSDNDSLLRERRQHAVGVIEDAMASINHILDDVTIEALQEQEIRNRLQNDRRDAANAVARLCGLPRGCTEEDLISDPSCVDVEYGSCGLIDPGNPDQGVAFDPGRVAASQAGSAALKVLEAFHNVAIQLDEVEGHLQKLDLEYEELVAFQKDVVHWNQMRLQGVRQLEANLAQRQSLRDQRINDMLTNIEARADVRQGEIEAMQDRFSEWNQMRISGAHSSFAANRELLALRRSADHLEMVTGQIAQGIDAVGKALPTVAGTSVDATSVARAGFWLAARRVEWAGQHIAMSMHHAAEAITIQRQRDSALGAARMAQMEEQAQVESAINQAQIDSLREQMMVSNQLSADELDYLREVIQLMEAQLQAELAYQRDMAEFRRRRTEHLKNHVETSGRMLRLERSRFNVLQRTAEYHAVVNEARLEAARMAELDQQLRNLDNLVGGIGAIFTQSHRLERAERHLQQGRDALMEWLVVLEYYAVRPFFEQRLKIMLARNAYQLEAIAEDLMGLEQTCGGSERSIGTATLSLRRDILGLTRSVQSEESGELIDPDERFRRWLTESHVPVDRRIRWSTSSSLNRILERTDGVLATTFQLRLDNFANLPLACNGKIESVALQVVGDVGDVRPTVSVLYDGTSQLRSCQPNIDEYVEAFGQGMTSYGAITRLRTAGRSMSPLAGVNEFSTSTSDVNRTLAGLPVASEYTLLIDTEIGDNSDVNWEGLEDILLEVRYSYQDLFPSACD